MHKIILFSLFILLSKSVYGEMIKPDPSIGPKEVILIQLTLARHCERGPARERSERFG